MVSEIRPTGDGKIHVSATGYFGIWGVGGDFLVQQAEYASSNARHSFGILESEGPVF